jgi:hypothetical protein
MSNVDSQQSHEPVAPIPQTANSPEAVAQEAASTADEEPVEAAQPAEEPAAPIPQTENAPEAVPQEAASTTDEEPVEAAQPAEVGQQEADQQTPDEA